ncbi:E3 ubiquitin-protein ligase synoviolin [Lambiella insularis]|nr:E3 ubiquitin-protein ligase synoviolin [Lambiella insularis]
MRFTAYAGTSMVLATGVIIRALHQRANFYSACVYLAQSNACLMVLTNLVLLGVCGVMLGLQKLLYGSLRPIEVEQLYEKAWFAVTETCLAMTIFREEVGGWFVVMFVSLLIGKIWGWIGEGRVEILEQQPPANPRLFHARLSVSLVLSICFEIYMLNYTIHTVRQQARPNMMVIFAFEFAVLTVTSMSTFARYTISIYEASIIKKQTSVRLEERRTQLQLTREEAGRAAQNAGGNQGVGIAPVDDDFGELDVDVPGWEDKGRWVFYLDLATDFFKLVLYLTFFCVLCMFYGMPIHIIRDVALTIRSFYKRITDFVRYRHATRDMNERYPDATAEEIGREDVCIICREAMRPWQTTMEQNTVVDNNTPAAERSNNTNERLRPKKLPCGHILHFACLRSWLERQQNCPTCRRPVLITASTVHMPAPQPFTQQGHGHEHLNDGINDVPGQQADQQANPRGNRIRVFNLGPFRLGFGAGQDVQGIVPHLNGQPPQQHHQNHLPARDPVQQFGFGLRFGRQTQPVLQQQGQMRPIALGVQGQLQGVEQQLTQEINDLRLQADQLYLVRALQGELARLRIAQAQTNFGQNTAVPGNSRVSPFSASMTNMTLPSAPTQQNVQVFNVHENQPGLIATSRDFPPGITLPEGWTLLPLQRLSTGTELAGQSGAAVHSTMNRPMSSSVFPIPSDIVITASAAPSGPAVNQSASDLLHSDQIGTNSRNVSDGEITTTPVPPGERPNMSRLIRTSMPSRGPLTHEQDLDLEPDRSVKETETAETSEYQTAADTEATTDSSWDDAQTGPNAERKAAKGKGRAPTVEDAAEEAEGTL